MDIEKLIEDLHGILKQYGEKIPYGELVGAPWPYSRAGDLVWPDPEPYFIEQAATALSMLQEENAQLRAYLEYEREHANAYHEECGQWEAENEKLRAELEQVKRDFDGICEYIDSEGFLRKQFCENGNSDLEPCICPSLKEHPGYIDSDDCEGCDHFCNSWRGPHKED